MPSNQIWPHTKENAARAEHGYLYALLDEMQTALQLDANREQAHRAFAHFAEALTGHLDREEKIYFPSWSAQHPEHRVNLQNLEITHEQLREQLSKMQSALHGSAHAKAMYVFEHLRVLFRAHEQEEERLFRKLTPDTQSL